MIAIHHKIRLKSLILRLNHYSLELVEELQVVKLVFATCK